jgi:hypothetical protein
MIRRSAVLLPVVLCPILCGAQAQAPARQMPPDYAGPQVRIPGVFVTPVPNAPFTAEVEIISHQKLPNGTENIRTTTNHIARNSAGMIYNERRMLVPVTFKGEPRLLSAHVYNPANRLNIFYEPATLLAREMILRPAVAARQMPIKPPVPSIGDPWSGMGSANAFNQVPAGGPTSNPAAATAINNPGMPPQPQITETDLGEQTIDGTILHGTRKQRTLPAEMSGTGKPITITTEYWYSPDLSVYLIVRNEDPRTGEQIVAVKHIERQEPPNTQFLVPDNYKVVDETPPPQAPAPPRAAR